MANDWTQPIFQATADLLGLPVGAVLALTDAEADYRGSGTYAVAFDDGQIRAMERIIPECCGPFSIHRDMVGGRRAVEFALRHPVSEVVLATGSGYELGDFFKPDWLD